MRIEQIMTKQVDVCRPEDTLNAAARIMWDDDCGCVPVVADDRTHRVVGMLTDRDICMAAYTRGERISAVRVADAMSRGVRSCSPESTPAEAEAIMRAARVRRLPVVDGSGALLGIVSLADLAREAETEKGTRRKEVTEEQVGATLAEICAPRA